MTMALVVDASVGLKWVLPEPNSHLAEELVLRKPDLLVPDFWMHEATNVLSLQVGKNRFTADEAPEARALLRAQIAPTPTADMALHDIALDIGIEVNHSTYETLYMAFAVAMGASAVVLADGPFVRATRLHPDASLAALPLPLDAWARSRGLATRRSETAKMPSRTRRLAPWPRFFNTR